MPINLILTTLGVMSLTKNSATSTENYKFTADHPIHLDANILVYLHPPLGKVRAEAKAYGSFVANARSTGTPLRVSILVIGEYVNTYSRLVFNSLYKRKYENLKALERPVTGRNTRRI